MSRSPLITHAIVRWLEVVRKTAARRATNMAQRRTTAETYVSATAETYASAMGSFTVWLQQQPHLQRLEDMVLEDLEDYVEHLKTRAAKHREDESDPTQRHLSPATVYQYVDTLCRWIAALYADGQIRGIPSERDVHLPPEGVRKGLLGMLDARAIPVPPRMPDLSRLPAYYINELRKWEAQHGARVADPKARSVFRERLSLLRNAALIATLFSSGGRISELLDLRVDDLAGVVTDAPRRTRRRRRTTEPLDAGSETGYGVAAEPVPTAAPAHVAAAIEVTGKGRKQRTVYLDDLARELVARYLQAREAWFPQTSTEFVFLSHGPKGKGQRLTRVSAWRIVTRAADALADVRAREGAPPAEIEALHAVTPHALRHHLAQHMLDRGAGYVDISNALGHSSVQVAERFYARPAPTTVIAAVKRHAPQPALRFTPVDSAPLAHDDEHDENTSTAPNTD